MALSRQSAIRFVIFLGVVSLLADVTYEGARSIHGPFFASLGVGAATVGFVAGAGELFGYTLRLASGVVADRTRRYWTLVILGYVVNLAAVPLLAFVHRWEWAAVLILLERTGKAIRNPSRDVMLSYAATTVGSGWAFGLHSALDQVGAFTGPLVVMLAMHSGGYPMGFGVLAIPAVMAIATLLAACYTYPNPHDLEPKRQGVTTNLPSRFWWYISAAGLLAAGYADFPLIAYHVEKKAILDTGWIPALYSLAMGINAITALIAGRLFDRVGSAVLPAGIAIAMFALPLGFLADTPLAAALAMVSWGTGMGVQDAALRAGIAGMVAPERRGVAYGTFNAVFGLMWFAGSVTMGLLADRSLPLLVAFGMTAQTLALLLFTRFRKPVTSSPE